MPNPFILIFLIVFALFALAATLVIFWWKNNLNKRVNLATDYSEKIENPARIHREFYEQIAHFNKEDINYDAQEYDWQYEMQKIGENLRNHNINNIIFVHGTFAGEDPFGIFHMVSELITVNDEIKNKIKELLLKGKNNLFKDLGNFSDDYIKLAQDALKIQCSHFGWSSENHHLARVEAAVNLIEHLVSYPSKSPILLIGHSHAGALFALITQFLTNKIFLSHILSECSYSDEKIKIVNKHINQLKKYKFDIVTMGSPIRYSWNDVKNIRALHIINHRGERLIGGSIGGSLTTKDGDYIQQWGISGSDGLAMSREKREINIKLDKYLGVGNNIQLWMDSIAQLKRVPLKGEVILVDYQDSSTFPNLHKTLFGHGTYTRYERILFNFKIIQKYFYAST